MQTNENSLFTKELQNDIIYNSKHALSLKILLIIINNNGFILENDLCSTFKKKPAQINKTLADLLRKDIIWKWISVGHGTTYSLNSKYFKIENSCSECKFKNSFKKSLKLNDKEFKIKYIDCNNKGPLCLYDKDRTFHNGFNILKSIYRRVDDVEVYKSREHTEKKKLIKDWTINDFVRYFQFKFKKMYPDAISFDNLIVKRYALKGYKIIKRYSIEKYNIEMKHYIKSIFLQSAKREKFVSIKSLSDALEIVRFLRERNKILRKVEFCSIKDVYCSYCINKECSLIASDIECTDDIVNKMKELHN